MRTHVYPRRSREQREERGRERPPCLPVQQVAAWRFALVYHALVTHAALFSILLLWPISVHAEKNLVRPPGTTRYKTMVRELNALVKYDKTREKRMTLSSLGHSVRGRDLWMVTLGSGPKRIFYLCRQHGHEPASTEGALAFISAVVKADTDTPTANCLKSVTVYVVPMANPDGSEAFLRHNAHDADINRDWITRGEPETKALYAVISKVRPDLLTDQHELYPDDTRPDFTEIVAAGSGASENVIANCQDAQMAVTGAMSAEGFPMAAYTVTDTHPARLAHRFNTITLGIPTVLFETNRLTGTKRMVAERASAHEKFMMTLLRYLGGDRDTLVLKTAGHPALPPTEQKGTD